MAPETVKANMLEEKNPAIVLRVKPYGESDKIVTFLTRDLGKVVGIAKGAKRSRRRFVNVLELFTHVELRFRSKTSNALVFVNACELIQTFRKPSLDIEMFAAANYITELTDVMVAGKEAGPEFYQLLLNSLQSLEDLSRVPSLFISAFEFRFLKQVGYGLNMDTCQICSVPVPSHEDNSATPAYSPSRGGVVCAKCAAKEADRSVLSPETLNLFQRVLFETPLTALPHNVSARSNSEVRFVLNRLLIRHLPHPLKSRNFLEQSKSIP